MGATLTLPLDLVLHRRGQLLDDVLARRHLVSYWIGHLSQVARTGSPAGDKADN